MNIDLNKQARALIKQYGDEAPAHFGVKKATLEGYIKRGKYPFSFIEKILRELTQEAPPDQFDPEPTGYPTPTAPQGYDVPPEPPQPETAFGSTVWDGRPTAPMPAPPPQPRTKPVEARVEEVVQYIQGTVDHFLNQFADRISNLERAVSNMRQAQMRQAQINAGLPGSLARPDQGVPVQQVFTTNPNPHVGMGTPLGMGNALDSGIAPTKAMVDAQANDVVIEGVHMRGAELAGPATFMPNQPAFGFGWNQPRPRK